MLLTLLSKRSLNVDSRDAYGFTVRPQHLQTYKEYTKIYKEEEEERLDKWKAFLDQQEESVDTHSARTQNLNKVDVETVNSEVKRNQFEGEEDNPVETNHTSDVQTTNENETEVVKSNLKDEVLVPPQTKREVVQTWAEIRSSLGALDHMMSFRVKKHKITNNEHITHSRGASTDENVEGLCSNEMLDDSTETSVTESEPSFPWKQELKFLVQGGVPRDLRGEVWQALVGAGARRVEKYYQDLLAPKDHAGDDQKDVKSTSNGRIRDRDDVPEKWKKQIEKDLPRTFPGHPALNENGRDSLRRILLAYARHNPSVGYCQALNFFAGLLLLMMPEENAFWTLVGIIDDYFDGYFSEKMTESQVDQLVFEELMRERFPKLANHLDYLGVEVTWITSPWFLSLFVNMLPWESVLRVWDVLLYEGNRVMLFRTALAIMELYGPAVATTQDAGDVICLLQALISSTFDSSQLVFTACMGFNTVTEDRLQGLREKHRPAVLAVLEERDRGDNQVCKQSKSLATKLASFKRDPGPLMQESENNKKLASFKVDPRPPMHESKTGEKLSSFKVDPRPPMQESETKEKPSSFKGGPRPLMQESKTDKKNSASDSHSAHQDEFLNGKTTDSEADSIPELQEQVVWLKIELSKLLEEKRESDRRGEELEAALMEMAKEDNRRELSAKNESLEQENAELRQALDDKKEQEAAVVQVLMRMEEEQKVTENARIRAEQDAAAQRSETLILEEKYAKAMASLTEMEKKKVMAESLLEATLQFQSGQSKASSSPRDTAPASQPRTVGLLSFWNKGKASNMATTGDSKTTNQGSQSGSSEIESNSHEVNKNSS